ncbi:MAG TPA: FAD:protein FMN transferase [Ktedonobacterales bacterium]|nr:FAD:protein FMN transferase [Ktedonobacterales bacterium]
METNFETPVGMRRAAFHAMGTTVAVIAPGGQIADALGLTRDLFDEWERTLSRFRPESELSRLNAAAGFPVAVSPLLLTTLLKALDAARATRGVFDPTVLQRMIEIGYDRTFEAMPPRLPAMRRKRSAQVGRWREIMVDEARRLVRLPAGVGLDFGGIAKGLAVDAALDLLTEHGVTPVLVNAGGDLGVCGLPPGLPHWPVTAPGKDEQWVIGLERGALATSGLGHRHWMQGDQPRHHLIDPRTGEPADSALFSVTAVAGACAQAEVAAKTALILGCERGSHFIEAARLGALLVGESGEWSAAGAWPREGMRRLQANDAAGQGVNA